MLGIQNIIIRRLEKVSSLKNLKKMLYTESYIPNWFDRIVDSGLPTNRIFDGEYRIREDDIEFIQSIEKKVPKKLRDKFNSIGDPNVMIDYVRKLYDKDYLITSPPDDYEGGSAYYI